MTANLNYLRVWIASWAVACDRLLPAFGASRSGWSLRERINANGIGWRQQRRVRYWEVELGRRCSIRIGPKTPMSPKGC